MLLDPTNVAVGDSLPTFVREGHLQAWNRYAAVNDEFVDIHMDDDSGRGAGYPAAFGMGNLQWAYLHNLLREWAGDEAVVTSLAVQFRGAFVRGRVVTAHGVVTAVEPVDGGTRIALDVWTLDDEGNRLAPGTASLLIPG